MSDDISIVLLYIKGIDVIYICFFFDHGLYTTYDIVVNTW